MYHRGAIASIALLTLVGAALAQDWKFEVVHLKNRERFEGLIVEETKEEIRFQRIMREAGAPTRAMLIAISRDEIDKIERLSEAERKELAQRVEQLDPRGEKEESKMRDVALQPAPWPMNGTGWAYTGKHFRLLSNAREDIVRRIVVRLEEIFQAYVEKLGSRRQPAQLTQVILYKSQAEYRASLRAGMNMLNPAFYDPQRNQIVAASDVEERADEFEKLKQKHQAMLRELDDQEKKLRKHFHGVPPAGMLSQIRQSRQNIFIVNNQNRDAYERLNRPLFITLYHEAFHAYLDNFVYPASEMPVPRWLNEGLAQIFETALVETGELRVGQVDAKRLAAVQDAIRKKELLSLPELLGSEDKHFSVNHSSEKALSDRYFQASWSLAYYLIFDRKLLGSEPLDRYIQALGRGTSTAEAFRALVGQPLPEFEKQFQQFILALKPDGTLKAPEKR
jgi:uncharacterized protein DUF1570